MWRRKKAAGPTRAGYSIREVCRLSVGGAVRGMGRHRWIDGRDVDDQHVARPDVKTRLSIRRLERLDLDNSSADADERAHHAVEARLHINTRDAVDERVAPDRAAGVKLVGAVEHSHRDLKRRAFWQRT